MSMILLGLGIFATVLFIGWAWIYIAVTIEDEYPEGMDND